MSGMKIVLPDHNLVLDPETRERVLIRVLTEDGYITIDQVCVSIRQMLESEDAMDSAGLGKCELMGNILCQIMDPTTATLSVVSSDSVKLIFAMGALWGRFSKNKSITVEVEEGMMTEDDDRLIQEAMEDPYGLEP